MKTDGHAGEHGHAKTAMFRDEKSFRLITDNLKEGVVVLDRSGDIVFWNKGAERILGYTEDELLGMNLVNMMASNAQYDESLLLKSYLETRVSNIDQDNAEFEGHSKDGGIVPLQATISSMEYESEPYVIVALRDITAKKEAERALQESEERYKLIENNLTDVIFITDLELKVLYISPTLYFQTGFQDEEFLGKSLANLITPESFKSAMERRAEEILKAGETNVTPPIPVGLNVEQYHKDGSTFPSEIRVGFLRRPDGTPYGALGVSRDITERVLLEAAERENAAANAAAEVSARYAAELKDIITIAAHELRLPATVFKGYSKILLDYRDKLDDKAVDRALAEINSASVRLNDLVASLLETSLIEQKKLSLDLSPVSPSTLINLALEGMGPGSSSNRLIIRGGDKERDINADDEKIARVLLILMDNALKYSPDEAEVEVSFDQGESETVFSVRDQGPGIPEDAREKVFNRFYQIEEVRNHSLSGLGLGLYIAKSIVELHNGWIRMEPAGDSGSLFTFGLPNA